MATTIYLLCSVSTLKEQTNIHENVSDKQLMTALREAQEIKLREVLGDALLDKLKDLCKAGAIDVEGNEMYRALVERSQFYLCYEAVAALAVKLSYKITNMGLIRTSGDNTETATWEEVVSLKEYYADTAASYLLQLQDWIYKNRTSFQELTQNGCAAIHANLRSAYDGNLWLGGRRGK